MSPVHSRRVTVALLAWALLATPALARGLVQGRVSDQSGQPVIGAKVLLLPFEDPGLRTYEVRTSKKGDYFIPAENGDYRLEVHADGLGLYSMAIKAFDPKGKPAYDWSGRTSAQAPPSRLGVSSNYKITVDVVLATDAVLLKEQTDALLARLGKALESGDRAGAEQQVRELLEKSPNDPTGLMLRGYLHLEAGNLAAAETDLKASLAAAPEMPDSHYELGMVYRRTDRPEEAIPEFLAVTKLSSDPGARARAWLNLGEIHRAAGRGDQAIDAMTRAIADQADMEPVLSPEIAAIHAEAGRDAEARAWLEKAKQAGTADANVAYNLAVTHFNAKRWPEAIEGFNTVLSLDPKFALAHRNLGYALMNQEKYSEAKVALQRYVELAPDADDAADVREILKTLGK